MDLSQIVLNSACILLGYVIGRTFRQTRDQKHIYALRSLLSSLRDGIAQVNTPEANDVVKHVDERIDLINAKYEF